MLSSLTGLNRRTIRYYIQLGLVERPLGEGRGAHYNDAHLGQLLQIKKMTSAGYSLEAIRQLTSEDPQIAPIKTLPQPGSVRVCSHILLDRGVELQISPEESELTTEEIRLLVPKILDELSKIKISKP
jgi:DNA-binding transcriptional MerR regulator